MTISEQAAKVTAHGGGRTNEGPRPGPMAPS
jgi:hypothetical protein